jgi:hypothetical protein
MSKVRADSTWSGVAVEKMEMLDGWLFEDSLCYREVKEKIKAEWNMEVSISSLSRYYRDREQEVALGDAADLQETADAVDGAPAKLDKLRSSAWKMIGVRLLERTLRRGNVKELAMLGRLMSESEWREIQRGRLDLAREKFEFNATKAALDQTEKVEDTDRDEQEREELKAGKISRNLFGRRCPR